MTLLVTGPAASMARAQESPPPGGPPAGPPAISAQAHDDLLAAGLAAAKEASALVELGGFGAAVARIASATEPLRSSGTDRDSALDRLDARDAEAATLLTTLTGEEVPLPPDATAVLSPLSEADLAAARQGSAISIQAETYVLALDELLLQGGGAPTGPPDPAAIAAALPGQGGGGSGTPWLPVAVVVAVIALAMSFLVRTLRGRARTPSTGSRIPSVAPAAEPRWAHRPGGPQDGIDELLEVSRRLTGATASGDIERAIVREAVGLVGATAAAVVRRIDERLVVGHQSQPDLLVVERLAEGMVGRVSETGQPVVQVSATEPAVRFLPVSLAAVPLVGGGRVDAVLVLVRSPNVPFEARDRDRLMALAPVAAAALQSARQAAAAVEDSLVDSLTGVGNRRRFDAELATTLSQANGRPSSLIMVDLDRFKTVNDTHGHPAGDALLRETAEILRETVRPGDAVYRYGGEEFVVVLPDTPPAVAAQVAERLRSAIAGRAFHAGAAGRLSATASLGVAASVDGDASGLVARADAALYRAKEAGRNRVVATEVELTATPD